MTKFKSDLGNEFFGKKGEKPTDEKPQPRENPNPQPKTKLIPFHCDHCGRDGHLAEFRFRRKHEEMFAREMANKDRYLPSRGVPESHVMTRGEGEVHTNYPRERHEIPIWDVPPQRDIGRRAGFGHGEFPGRSFTCGQYEYRGNDCNFRSQRRYGPWSPLHGTRSPPRRCVGVLPRSDMMDFANPTFEQMAQQWSDSFRTNPSAESFAHSRSHFLFSSGRHGGLLVDRL
jgi:hypothetical protein